MNTPFTNGNNQHSPLFVSRVEYVTSLPMYPDTSRTGVAYIVPVARKVSEEWPTPEEVAASAFKVMLLQSNLNPF